MAEHAFVRRGAVVDVNYYLPCVAKLDEGIQVTVGGNYPVSETVTLDVQTTKPVMLALRVPKWCPELTVDGNVFAVKNERVEISVSTSRLLTLRFLMPVRIVSRPCLGEPELLPGSESDGRGHDGRLFLYELAHLFPEMKGVGRQRNAAFVMRGPLVLTKARLMGLGEKEIFSSSTINGETGWEASTTSRTVPSGVWGAWNLTLQKDNVRHTIPVCDLPSAAPSDDWQNAFSIWF